MDAAVSIGNVDHPRSRRRREWQYAWMFSGPAALVPLLMMAFPVAYTLYLSVTNWTPTLVGSAKFVGLQNYIKLIAQDERFHNALWRTIWFTTAGVSIQCVLGVGLALIFNREFAGRGLFRTVFLMSMVATPVAIALVWMMILDINTGILNYLLNLVAGVRVVCG